MQKMIYFFGEGPRNQTERNDLLGGKGAGLNEMTCLGIPVPPGFTIATSACREFLETNEWPKGLEEKLKEAIKRFEKTMGSAFGDAKNPLLISVRSGAKVSMPGMMETILNLGLNDETAAGLARLTKNQSFADDCYRRFKEMFTHVVGGTVPQNPWEQLKMAIDAVFHSWNTPRAKTYRRIHSIPEDLGTAVNIQAMVFGNRGEKSATGVAFTRSPSTGEKKFFGEFLMNAQGEDVVAGIRTPEPIEKLAKMLPEAYTSLMEVQKKLEGHFNDMQDIEFTIEEGKLYLLQTRNGKRTAHAAVKIAVDMAREGMISRADAIKRVNPVLLDQLLHPALDPNHGKPVIARGLPASPGAGSGRVVFESKKAFEAAQTGEKVILVRKETSPDDIDGMHAAQGILTATGGMTSHAAVVARGMNKCCVAGCGDIIVNLKAEKFVLKDGREVRAGDVITLNGTTGEVVLGEVATIPARIDDDFRTLLAWADEFSDLEVRANADTPHDATVAIDFGARGVGLCRTEHMFFELDRIPVMQEMILSKDREARIKALDKLEVMQTNDFYGIFKAMEGYPVTIRLLDPPLHEFLPRKKQDIEALAQTAGLTYEQLRDLIESMTEVNPMLGHRGCRLMVTYPEITEMQTRAIMNAAVKAMKEGIETHPEIMIPLVGTVEELTIIRDDIKRVADEVLVRHPELVSGSNSHALSYKIGTMIEIPRACLVASKIAKEAEFFSFGTNDLTQMTYGYSRDDAGRFIQQYRVAGILKEDPFMTIDQEGVGELVRMTVRAGREENPMLKIGVCGEHGGDPKSIAFFHGAGLNYVSCSPYRVPVARLAAAQAALRDMEAETISEVTVTEIKVKEKTY